MPFPLLLRVQFRLLGGRLMNTILVSAIVGGIVSVITAYITTQLRMREEAKKWQRDFLLKYSEAKPEDRQNMAGQFAAGYLIVETPE